MFCMKCGQKLDDGARFCAVCGTPVNVEPAPAAAPVEQTPEQPAPELQTEGQPSPETFVTQPPMGNPAPEQPFAPQPPMGGSNGPVPPFIYADPMPPVNKPAPKGNVKKIALIAGIAVAVVILIVAGILLVPKLFSGNQGNGYVYLADGSYMLVRDVKKDEGMEIASAKFESIPYENCVYFSKDGKYVYYFTKVDSGNSTGTLCRGELSRLRDDPAKNEKYIKVIATNVKLGLNFLDNGNFYYRNGENSLYYFDGEEAVRVARSIDRFWIDEEEHVLYSVYHEEEESQNRYALYQVDSAKPDEPEKLIDAFASIEVNAEDLTVAAVTVVAEDEIPDPETGEIHIERRTEIWAVGYGREKEKLTGNGSVAPVEGDSIIFVEESDKKLYYKDYVIDENAAADEAMTEPLLDNYGTPYYRYDLIRSANPVQSDYAELYTSTTLPLFWYGESSWNSYSMESAVNVNWGDNSDAIVEWTYYFINNFKHLEDENGLIPVTPEVQEALMQINAASDDGNPWLWLCLAKVQDGVEYDREAYDRDYTLYWEAMDRNSYRERLNDPENYRQTANIYSWKDGEKTLLLEDVIDLEGEEDCGYVRTLYDVTQKLDFNAVYMGEASISDLFNFNMENLGENVQMLNLNTGKVYTLAAETFKDLVAANDGDTPELMILDKKAYHVEDNGAMTAADIKDGAIGEFKILTDDARIIKVEDDVIYYVSGVYSAYGTSYGDLYSLKGDSKTCLAKDIMMNTAFLYEDGILAAYTESSGYSYELTLFDKNGESTLISDSVYQYMRLGNKYILYLSDGDLYCWNGEESERIDEDVEDFWAQNPMEDTVVLPLFMGY